MNESTHPKESSWLNRLGKLLLREPQDQQELLSLLTAAKDRDVLDESALSMIEGIIEFSSMQVRDIMIPRSQMVVIERDETIDVFLSRIVESGHSRFPLIGEDKDDILGVLLAKDLLPYASQPVGSYDLKDISRPATFVPESKRLNVLLQEFRSKRNHMAIVIDEYGGVAGLITIEDVLEEIVGEIEDEHDIEEDDNNIKQNSNNEFAIKALTPIAEFNEYFNVELSDEEFDTIGGLVTSGFGHVPKSGETIEIGDFTFTVLRSEKRLIRTLIASKRLLTTTAAE